MRYGLVLGCVAAAGLWAASAFAQDCCAGSKVDGGRYKQESGSSLEAKAWMRISAPPASIRGSDPSVPVASKPR